MFAVVLSAGSLSTPLQAQTTNWATGTGSWFTSGNWDNGIPTAATTNSNVTNGGTAQIAGGAANTGNTLTISGGSTVDVQAGGSVTAGTVVLGNNGTLLLSGSTAVGANCVPSPGCIGFSPFSGIEFDGGTVRSTTTGSMPSSIKFGPDASGTILAAAGQTVTISGDLFFRGISSEIMFMRRSVQRQIQAPWFSRHWRLVSLFRLAAMERLRSRAAHCVAAAA